MIVPPMIRKQIAVVLAILSFLPYFLVPAAGLFEIEAFAGMTFGYALLINLVMLYLSRMLYLGTWKPRWNEWPW